MFHLNYGYWAMCLYLRFYIFYDAVMEHIVCVLHVYIRLMKLQINIVNYVKLFYIRFQNQIQSEAANVILQTLMSRGVNN